MLERTVLNSSQSNQRYSLNPFIMRKVRESSRNSDGRNNNTTHRELTQPRRRQGCLKLSYLTIKETAVLFSFHVPFYICLFRRRPPRSFNEEKFPVLQCFLDDVNTRQRILIFLFPSPNRSYNRIMGYLGHICKSNDLE